MAKTTSQKA